MRIYEYNNQSNFTSNKNLYVQSSNIYTQPQSEKKTISRFLALSPSMIREIIQFKKESKYFSYKKNQKNFTSRNSNLKSASLNNHKIILTENQNIKKKIPKMTKIISNFIRKNYTPNKRNKNDIANASYTTRTKSNLSISKNYTNNYLLLTSKNKENSIKKLPNFPRYAQTSRLIIREKVDLTDFKNETRNLRYLKYLNLSKTKDITEFKENISYNKTQIKCDLFLFINCCKLLKLHILNLTEYIQFLHRAFFPEQKKDYILITQIRQLKKDIRNIKDRMKKIQTKFEICLNNKIFLLCVKNHTLNYKNFTDEEQNIIFYDIWKLLDLNSKNNQISLDGNDDNYIENENSKFINFVSDLNMFKRRLYNNIISDNLYLNYIMDVINMFTNENIYDYFTTNNLLLNSKYNKQKLIFNSVEDFQKKYDGIFINIQKLLEEDFIINSDINHGRFDYNEIKKLIGNKGEVYEWKYYLLDTKKNIQKIISNNNSKELKLIKEDQLKFKKLKNSTNKISKNINNIINNIIKTNDDYIYKKFLENDKISKKNILEKLNLLERIVNFLKYYKKYEKVKNPEIYENCIKKFKQEKIEEGKKIRKLEYKKIYELKVNKIIEKMKKCPYIQRKKVNYLCKSELKTNNKYKKLFE